MIMGSATGWDEWDTSHPIFLLFNTTPMGVAWKESTSEGLRPPQYSEGGGAAACDVDGLQHAKLHVTPSKLSPQAKPNAFTLTGCHIPLNNKHVPNTGCSTCFVGCCCLQISHFCSTSLAWTCPSVQLQE